MIELPQILNIRVRKFIDDFIEVYEDLRGLMQRWKDKGIILDPDIIGGVGDDYAQFCTYDEKVALQENFEEEGYEGDDDDNDDDGAFEAVKNEFFQDWADPSDSSSPEFEVNKYISLKLILKFFLINHPWIIKLN